MKKILIIDDDEFSQRVYGDGLEEAGFLVVHASDGKTGLEMAKTEKPDAIVLDVVMPEMDGFAALAELKRDSTLRAVPVIMLSGAASEEDFKRCKELGATLCLSKLTNSLSVLVEYLTTTLIKGLPLEVSTPTTNVGELSNTIFVQASHQIQAVIAQMLHNAVTIGNFKATAVSSEVFKEHLDELTEQTGLVASYSVLKPPMGAAMLMISKETTLALASLLEGPEAAPPFASGLTEIYNVISNTFLNVITAGLKADSVLLFQPPLLSTPDIAVRLMRKDGFVLEPGGINFIFRQTYTVSQINLTFEFILLLSTAGLELLKKWKQAGGGLNRIFFNEYMNWSESYAVAR